MAPRQESGDASLESNNADNRAISRREFARRAALTTASVAAIPAALFAEIKEPPDRVGSGVAGNSQSAPQEAVPRPDVSPSEAEVENKFESILTKYGTRFNDAQKADIRRLLGETQKQLDRLRAYSLDNSDQPATVLKPLMERTTHPSANPNVRPPANPPGRSPASAKPGKHGK